MVVGFILAITKSCNYDCRNIKAFIFVLHKNTWFTWLISSTKYFEHQEFANLMNSAFAHQFKKWNSPSARTKKQHPTTLPYFVPCGVAVCHVWCVCWFAPLFHQVARSVQCARSDSADTRYLVFSNLNELQHEAFLS